MRPRRPPEPPTSCSACAAGSTTASTRSRPPSGRRPRCRRRSRTRSSAWRAGWPASTTRTSGASTKSSPRPPIRSSSSSTTPGGGCRRRGRSTCRPHGRGLIVSNHSGSVFPFDATMIGVGIMKEHPLPRWTRALVLNWAFELPFLSYFMRKVGGVPGQSVQRQPAARAGPPGDGLPRGRQGHRQAVLGALPAAALRPRRLRRGGAAHRRPDHPDGGRRRRGDLPEDRRLAAARPPRRRALRADHPDLPLARAARPDPAAVEVADRVLRARSTSPNTGRRPPTTRRSSSTSPSRSARRSRRSSTTTWSSAAPPSSR